MNLIPYGDRALLLEVATTEEVVAVAEAVRADPSLSGLLEDVVPGARTVLLVAPSAAVVPDLRVAFSAGTQRVDQVRRAPARRTVEIAVTYDGPDLAEVARMTGLSEDDVVAAHTGTPWKVAFGGFAPGFAYLVGGDPRLQVPRRDSPRTSVPAGSVGLAGEFSGVYPRTSPGGWRLIGRTEVAMWDLDRDPPALLAAGTTVRFTQA